MRPEVSKEGIQAAYPLFMVIPVMAMIVVRYSRCVIERLLFFSRMRRHDGSHPILRIAERGRNIRGFSDAVIRRNAPQSNLS